MNWEKLPGEEPAAYRARLKRLEKELKALDDKRRYRRIDFFTPYPKQQEFFDLGSVVPERMFRAGNQSGKSEAGAAEMSYHLTGDYPEDWFGHRFTKPVTAWACGESGNMIRDISQQKLFGKYGLENELGTGFVPRDNIVGKPSMARGVTDAFDTVHVQHRTDGVKDGISTITFKSYEQGRAKFQGTPVDVIWLDEEPDMEIYLECVARTLATKGILYTTFTPLHGITKLFTYMTDPAGFKFRREVLMTYLDIPGITQEEIDRRIGSVPAWQRKARLMGEPLMGEGAVFAVNQESISEATMMSVPEQWYKLWGIDFGINEDHKFAAVCIAWDKDADCVHVLAGFKVPDQTPLQHAVPMKAFGINVPVAWPHDGWARERGTGEPLSKLYRAQGLKMCADHATFIDGGYSTEAGITEMDERMKTGRLKVAAHLSDWFAEFRSYHRKGGLIVKQNDDLLSATRIAVMAKRMGKQVVLGGKAPARNNDPNRGMARHVELSGDDLF